MHAFFFVTLLVQVQVILFQFYLTAVVAAVVVAVAALQIIF